MHCINNIRKETEFVFVLYISDLLNDECLFNPSLKSITILTGIGAGTVLPWYLIGY